MRLVLVRAAVALSLLAALAAAREARACSVCSRGDPIAPAADGQGEGGDLRLAIDTELISQRTGTPSSPAGQPMHDELDQFTVKLTTVYSPTAPLNLVASLPFTRKRMTMDHGGGVKVLSSDLSGAGDVEVGARWFFWEQVSMASRTRQGLALSAGSTLPTGASDPSAIEVGQPNPQHQQLGAGSFGPYAGLGYRLQRDAFAALLSVSGRAHTANAQGYRYGGAALWTVQGQWSPTRWLALGLGLDGHHGRQDRLGGAAVANTGGTVIWGSPSAFMNVYRKLWLTLRAQAPVYNGLTGDQTIRPVVMAGLQYQVF